jgi:hypothetical protein
VIVVAAFETPAVVAGLDDVAMVGQAVEKRGGHLGVAEHAGPFTEGKIGGDDDIENLACSCVLKNCSAFCKIAASCV